MGEGFFGLGVAVRGLYSAQRNLDVINHNLNNVNTPGYSRQRAVQEASRPLMSYDGTGMIGTGSEVVAIERVRDEYLDSKYWSEQITSGEWDTKKALLQDMEATFNEPSDSGFTKIMDDFFSSLQELSKDPASEATRALVRERGVTMAKYFNSIATHFEKLQEDANARVAGEEKEVNSLAKQIQQLNRQIYTTELDGNTANDLRDQRTLLIDKLSRLINISVNEVNVGKLPNGNDDKRLVISIGGKALVNHFDVTKLKLTQRSTNLNAEDIDNLYDIQWEDGNELNITGGELKGYLDVRDGNSGLNGSPSFKGIPYYLNKMNEFARTFAIAFNEGYIDSDGDGTITSGENGLGHVDGYKLNSAAGDAASGIRFFTMTGADGKPVPSSDFAGAATIDDIVKMYQNVTAKNLVVSEKAINNIGNISASGAAGEKGNINNLNALINLRHNTHMFSEGAPEDFMKSLVASLGIDSQQALAYSGNQKIIVKQIENRRLSDSGVSVDEEMSNMIKFQQTYNACARMIATMSEIYDILLNRIGI